MVDHDEIRKLATSLPEVAVEDHHGVPSYRVRGKIFATVPDDDHLHVMLDGDDTGAAIRDAPDACEELWWGKKLAGVRVRLAAADHDTLDPLVRDAWRRVAPLSLQ